MNKCTECGCENLEQQILEPKHSGNNHYWIIWNCTNCGSTFDKKV